MYHMKHLPPRKLADAIFRGQAGSHIFKVYPLSAPITDQPAVFIISRRITDRRGKGHQATICIGETESVLSELKKHKKSRCTKDNSANVICLLKERDPETRVSVIDDLIAGRSFACVQNVYEPKIEAAPKRNKVKAAGAAKAAKAERVAKAKAVKPEPVVKPKSKASNAKTKPRSVGPAAKSSPASSKRAAASKTASRISRGVDSDGRQHRLSKPKRAADRRPKARVARVARPRTKAAA
jgi:hypothetical protein